MPQRTASSAAAARSAARIAGAYAGGAGAWLLVSDTALGGLAGGAAPVVWNTIKGLLFVAVTATLLYAALRDILVRAAQARQEAEKLSHQLEFALEASQGGTWQYERPAQAQRVDAGMLQLSPALRRAIGGAQAPAKSAFRVWLERVHPDDVDIVRARTQDALLGDAGELDLQYRLRYADGSWRTVLIRGRPEPGGEVWHGVMLDVSEHARNRERLALLGRVFETSSEGVVVADGRGRIVASNPAAQQLLGVGDAALVKRSLQDLLLGSRSEPLPRDLETALLRGERWHGRIGLNTGGDRQLRLSLRLSPVRDAAGTLRQIAALMFDVTEIEQTRERIRDLQEVDALTGLPTARRFLRRLDDQLQHASSTPVGMHVVVCDIVGFHAINETFGRDAGDRVLRSVTERLHAIAPPEAMLARVAGNRFALAFPGSGSAEPVESTVERLRQTLAQPLGLGTQDLYLDCAFGSSLFPADAANAEQLLLHAQTALHEAKRQGRSEHRRYTARLTYDAQDRLQLVADLRAAIEREELSCYFQPKVRLADRRVVGAEALLRWQRGGETLLPGRFLAYAEEAGLMAPIGRWILRAALGQVSQWRRDGLLPDGFRVAVNVAQAQIDAGLADTVSDALGAAGLPAHALELELTEGIVDAAWDQARRCVRDLRLMGVAIALDDFGTGYSSLARLKQLQVDILKIDQSFTRDLDHAGTAAVVGSMVLLGRNLGCSLTAEGVETVEQLEQLASAGCDFGQGFLFGRAIGADAFVDTHLRSNGR